MISRPLIPVKAFVPSPLVGEGGARPRSGWEDEGLRRPLVFFPTTRKIFWRGSCDPSSSHGFAAGPSFSRKAIGFTHPCGASLLSSFPPLRGKVSAEPTDGG